MMNALDKLQIMEAEDLKNLWIVSEKMMTRVRNGALKDEDADALLVTRGWIMKAMQEKMSEQEFCKMVGA
jgi:hypothetical protein